jgi:hypothetical protein
MFETLTSALESTEQKSEASGLKAAPPEPKSGITPSTKAVKNQLDLTGAPQSGSKGEAENINNENPAEDEVQRQPVARKAADERCPVKPVWIRGSR